MQAAGVLLGNATMQPSSKGARIKVAAKKPTIIDGPFTESKELIAGYIILNVTSVQAAYPWAVRFAEVVGDVEMDLLPLFEPG
jgi:hypothetical protein